MVTYSNVQCTHSAPNQHVGTSFWHTHFKQPVTLCILHADALVSEATYSMNSSGFSIPLRNDILIIHRNNWGKPEQASPSLINVCTVNILYVVLEMCCVWILANIAILHCYNAGFCRGIEEVLQVAANDHSHTIGLNWSLSSCYCLASNPGSRPNTLHPRSHTHWQCTHTLALLIHTDWSSICIHITDLALTHWSPIHTDRTHAHYHAIWIIADTSILTPSRFAPSMHCI